MQDGLYFFGQWVTEVDVAITKQANDLTNPTQLNATYANIFQIPDTTAVRKLLQNAEQVDAGGVHPYRLIPAKLIDEGETIFSGFASLQSFQGGLKVSLSSAMKSLFDLLGDTKISELDLSRYDHLWTIESIATFAQNESGIVYPAIDYGSISNGIFPQDTLTPGIYAMTLIGAMLQANGYRPEGAWLSDSLIKRIVLPFVNDEPKGHSDQWRLDRQARVTVTGTFIFPPFNTHFDGILQFNRDNEILNNWIDGAANNYKAESVRYVCDVPMRLHVTAFQKLQLKIDFGAVEYMLIVEKNGVNVAQEYDSQSGPYNLNLTQIINITLDEYIECRAGDQIQIRLVIQKRTAIAQYVVTGFVRDTDTWASFEPDTRIISGDTWPVAANLPDITCAELIKSVALMCSGTFDIDDTARTVTLRTLDAVIANQPNATDLSNCIEESDEPENAFIIAPYGQKNLLKWKEQEDKNLIGYGDGVIACNAQNIPLETPLFELPFAAVTDSKTNIPGYGNPPFIQTRIISGEGTTVQVQKQSAQACLVLVEPTKPVSVIVNVVTPELTVVPTTIPLTACWWYTRPIGLVTPDNAFSLAFDRPMGASSAEQTLIQRYFGGLRRVLRRPRLLTVPLYLPPAKFATLNLYAPVRLRGVRAGSLDLNDNFYYLNKVNTYVSGKPCTISLIPY